METVERIVQVVYVTVSVIGAIVALWGVVEAVYGFLRLKFSGERKDDIAVNESLRQRLGAHLLLGLEIFRSLAQEVSESRSSAKNHAFLPEKLISGLFLVVKHVDALTRISKVENSLL